MGGAHGVVNTNKVLDVIWEGGNVAEDIAKAEGNTLQKLSPLMSLFDELMALPDVDWAEFKAERGEYDSEDWAAMVAHAKSKFDLDDDVLEAKIEEDLSLAKEGVEFAIAVRDYVKSLKA